MPSLSALWQPVRLARASNAAVKDLVFDAFVACNHEADVRVMSALPPKADIAECERHVADIQGAVGYD